MKNLKVSTRILLSFGIIISMLVVITAVLYVSKAQIINDVDSVAINNAFSTEANNLLMRFNTARAEANILFTQTGYGNYQQTIDAIEETHDALDTLYEMVDVYPAQLSIYRLELDAINECITVYLEAVEHIQMKRAKQANLFTYVLYCASEVDRMFNLFYDSQYRTILRDSQNITRQDLFPNIERIRLLDSLKSEFVKLIDDFKPLLYQNEIGGYDEISQRFDEYSKKMEETIFDIDGMTRSYAVNVMTYLAMCYKSVSEYKAAAIESAVSIENANIAQNDLQSKTALLLITLENTSRSHIDATKVRARQTINLMLIGLVASILAGLILTFLMSKSITDPVEKMVAAARRLARGDDIMDLDISSTDEVGKLAMQMQEMIISVKKREKALSFKSERDMLTGLFNKVTTARLITQFLQEENSKEEDSTHALFFIDLDNFKPVNDTLGHDYGDRVLCEFAEKLRTFFRTGDIIGRVGGDEFIVLAKNIPNPEFAKKRAAEACRVLPLTYHELGREFVVACCIGVCFFTAKGSNFEDLSKSADTAMYVAKRGGKGTYHLYS